MLHPLVLLGELVLLVVGTLLLHEGAARPVKRSTTFSVLLVMLAALLLGGGSVAFFMTLGWLFHGFIGACIGLGVAGIFVYILLNAAVNERN